MREYYPDGNYEELYKIFPELNKNAINNLAFYYGIKAKRIKNKVGNKYGLLTVKKMIPNYKNGRTYCLCDCDCGNKNIYIQTSNLRYDKNGKPLHTTSCGCLSSRNGTKQFDFLYKYRFDSDEKIYLIYKHTAPNGKCYIGMTKQTIERRSQNGEGYNTQRLFYNAIKKYGWDNFKHEVLEDGLTHDEACEKEIYYIDKYKSNIREYGYNVTSGGDGCANVKNIKIGQFTEDNKLVNVFNSIKECAKILNLSSSTTVSNWCDGKLHHGYYWKRLSEDKKDVDINYDYLSFDIQADNKEIKKYNLLKVDNTIKINQYSLSGKYIRTWNSIKEAGNSLHINTISYALKNNSTAGGFQWRYFNGDCSDIQVSRNGCKRSVIQIDIKSHQTNFYKSLIDAENDTGVNFRLIWKVCNGQAKTAGGYIWRYTDEV